MAPVDEQQGGVPEGSQPERGHLQRATMMTAAARARAQSLAEQAQAGRENHSSLDAVFEIVDTDVEVGGGIIAGALAFRLFLWQLPLALVLVGGLGVIAGFASGTPKSAAHSLGMAGLVSSEFRSTASSSSPWYALLVGLPLLVLATRSVLRVLIGVHRLAWADARAAAPKPKIKASLLLLASFLCLYALALLAGWLRARSAGLGVAPTVAAAAGFAGIWLLVSLRLPHRGADWRALVPGALMFGVGLGALQILAVYLLVPYALAKEGVYGSFGIAAALLLGLFFVGRLIVVAAETNATLWQRRERAKVEEGR